MDLKEYRDSNAFWDAVSPALREDEARNSLFLGVLSAFRAKPDDCLHQSALFDGGVFVGAALCTRYRANRNLLPTPLADLSRARPLFEALLRSGADPTEIVGERATAREYERLFREAGRTTRTHAEQGIFRCDRVAMPAGAERLGFRAAGAGDVALVGGWIEAFHREAIPHDPPIVGRDAAAARIGGGMLYLIEENGAPVSMAAWSRDLGTSCSVNLVYTPPALRGRGYASAVTARLTRRLLDGGKRETNLYTDLANPTSNKIYRDIGYRFVCESVHLAIGP